MLFATVIAFVIAEGIPVFSGLVGLVGALFGTTMSITTMGEPFPFRAEPSFEATTFVSKP